MLEASIIEPIEESDWVSPMVVQEKKQKGEIQIFVDLRKLNDACIHDAFPTSFNGEVLMSPKVGNISGSFGLIILAQSFIFHNLCIIFSMFVSFVRIRVVIILGG